MVWRCLHVVELSINLNMPVLFHVEHDHVASVSFSCTQSSPSDTADIWQELFSLSQQVWGCRAASCQASKCQAQERNYSNALDVHSSCCCRVLIARSSDSHE